MDADRLTPFSIAEISDEAALVELLKRALSLHASDLFILPGAPVTVKCDGRMLPLTQERMLPADTARMIAEIYRIAGTRESASLERTGDDDFSFSLADVSRFRCNAYRQRGTLAAVLRVVPFGLPDPATLHIPPEVMALAEMRRGLVLVTGSAGSGKSTTLACLIDRIDRTRSEHIITIEDPIEFLYPHRQSIVSQREVAHDTETFQTALRASLRQAPDVILLGELLGLRWQDVDFENQTITIVNTLNYAPGAGVYVDTPKNATSARPLKLSPTAFSMLLEYKRWQDDQRDACGDYWKDTVGRVFTGDDGAPVFPDSLTKWFSAFVKRSGLPDVHIHSLRHTYASLMIADGTPLVVISRRLGHAQVSTTANIYSHVIASADEKAAQISEKFADVVSPTAGTQITELPKKRRGTA